MNNELLSGMWEALNATQQYEIRALARYPTERNACYMTGYFAALSANHLLRDDPYTYWLAAIGQIENDPDFRKEVLNLTKGE